MDKIFTALEDYQTELMHSRQANMTWRDSCDGKAV